MVCDMDRKAGATMWTAVVRTLSAAMLLATVTNVSPGQAGPFEDGYAALSRGDIETALQIWRELADDGNADAQFNLGYLYDHGRGVREDPVEAMRWYRQAAVQGDAIAQFTVGAMYEGHRGVPLDYVQAHLWYGLAASRFTDAQAEDRKRAVASRDRVAAKMTPAQIAEAQKLAQEWKPK